MNKKHYLVGIASLAIVGSFFFTDFKTEKKEYYAPSQDTEELAVDQHFEYLHSLRANQVTNEINPADIAEVKSQIENASKLHKQFPIQWTTAGPDNVGGRTRAILVDRNDNNILYAGSVSGGLWKSTNKGGSWYPVNDQAENLNVASITQTVDGTIYYGTGEGFASTAGGTELGTPGFPGAGIFKSTDGGKTFEHLTNTQGYLYTNRMVAHPTQNIVFAATNTGLRYSDDGGASWTLARAGNCRDVAIDKNGNVLVYAANRVYRSTDPTNTSSYTAVTGGATGTRATLAFSLSDPNYAYICAVANVNRDGTNINGGLLGIWQSKDNGENFTQIVGSSTVTFDPFAQGNRGQGTYDQCIAVHPTNPERLFIGGIFWGEWSVTNGPQIIGNLADDPANPFGIHADKHFITFDTKSNPPIMYIGHDGGVTKTTNANLDRYATINNGYQTTQFYGIAASRDGKVIGGTQDQRTQLIDGNGSSPFAGVEILGGDGFKCEISQKNNNIFFVTSINGALRRSLNGGGTPASFYDNRVQTDFVSANQASNVFNTPVKLWEGDSADDNNLFYGLDRSIWMARNATNAPSPSWFKIAATNFAPHVMETSADGDHLFFAGLNNSQIFRVDGITKANWDTSELIAPAQISDSITVVNIRGNLPSRTVTDIEVDINDPNHVIVTFGNYGNTSYVYRTRNALDPSPTWTSIQGALPRFPVYDAEINYENPNEIILGTEYGIWAAQNGNAATPTWSEQNDGFPRVPVFEMRQVEIYEKDQNGNYVWRTGPTLYAGTHGRGIFKTSSFLTSVPKINSVDVSLDVYPNPASETISLQLDRKAKGTCDVQIMDLHGRLVKEFSMHATENKQMNIAELKTGTYILSVTGSNFKASTKFIKYN